MSPTFFVACFARGNMADMGDPAFRKPCPTPLGLGKIGCPLDTPSKVGQSMCSLAMGPELRIGELMEGQLKLANDKGRTRRANRRIPTAVPQPTSFVKS